MKRIRLVFRTRVRKLLAPYNLLMNQPSLLPFDTARGNIHGLAGLPRAYSQSHPWTAAPAGGRREGHEAALVA